MCEMCPKQDEYLKRRAAAKVRAKEENKLRKAEAKKKKNGGRLYLKSQGYTWY